MGISYKYKSNNFIPIGASKEEEFIHALRQVYNRSYILYVYPRLSKCRFFLFYIKSLCFTFMIIIINDLLV